MASCCQAAGTAGCRFTRAATAAYSVAGDLSGDGGVVKNIVEYGKQATLKPANGDEVTLHYRAAVRRSRGEQDQQAERQAKQGDDEDDNTFESTYAAGEPLVFRLGAMTEDPDAPAFSKALDLVAASMARGERARVALSAPHAAGAHALPPLASADRVVADVEMVAWTRRRALLPDGAAQLCELLPGNECLGSPGALAEVTVEVSIIAAAAAAAPAATGCGGGGCCSPSSDAKPPPPPPAVAKEEETVFKGELTYALGDGTMPPFVDDLVKDLKKDATVRFDVRAPYAAALPRVPERAPRARATLALREWRRFHDVLDDGGTVVKHVLRRADAKDAASIHDGAVVSASLTYFCPPGPTGAAAAGARAMPRSARSALGAPFAAENDVEVRVGEFDACDGVDRALSSMRAGEVSLFALAANRVFGAGGAGGGAAAALLSAAGVADSSSVVVEIEVSAVDAARTDAARWDGGAGAGAGDSDSDALLAELERRKQRGNALFMVGRHFAAQHVYTRALQLCDRASRPAHAHAGRAEVQKRARALRLDCLLNLAMSCVRDAQFERAAECCEAALALDPGSVKALYRLALACIPLDRLDEAERSLRRAAEIDPGNEAVMRKAQELKQRRAKLDAGKRHMFANMFQ